MNLKARTLAVALALAAVASPLRPGVAAAATHHRAHHHDGDRASYPMKGDEFRKLMEKRIDAVRTAIDRKLERRGVSSDRKKAIHRIFDEASKDLRAEIDRVAAGKTVTHADAEKAKTLASGLRARVRARLRAEKSPKPKEKLAHEDAAKKPRSGHMGGKAPKKAGAAGAPDHPDHADHASPHPKASPEDAPGHAPAARTRAAKASHAKPAHDADDAETPGPTRTAKVPATRKRKHAGTEPGSRL